MTEYSYKDTYWTSKLGNTYPKKEIENNEHDARIKLDQLRKLPYNRICADCQSSSSPTLWASVNLGIFLCIRCGSIHRGLGTHISKPKGCTGTYLWGPDELERMALMGNARSNELYGCGIGGDGGGDGDEEQKHRRLPSSHDSDAVWRKYIADKYVHRLFVQQRRDTVNVKDKVKIKAKVNVNVKSKQPISSHDVDLLSFDSSVDTTPTAHNNATKNKQNASSHTTNENVNASYDFFSQFGV